MNNFGTRLKQLRLENNLTRTQLAEKLSLSVTMIANYETKEVNLYAHNLIKISRFFNVKVDWLLGLI